MAGAWCMWSTSACMAFNLYLCATLWLAGIDELDECLFILSCNFFFRWAKEKKSESYALFRSKMIEELQPKEGEMADVQQTFGTDGQVSFW